MKRCLFSLLACCMLWFTATVWAQNVNLMSHSTDSERAEELVRQAIVHRSHYEITQCEELLDEALALDNNYLMAHMLKMSIDSVYAVDNVDLFEELMQSASPDEQKLAMIWSTVSQRGSEATRGPKRFMSNYVSDLSSTYSRDNYLQLHLAYMTSQMGNDQQAMSMLMSILFRTPNFSPAHNAIGYMYMEEGNMKKAEMHFNRYMELEPGKANPYDSKGDYYMEMEMYKQAHKMYAKAYKMNPDMKVSKEKAVKAKKMMKQN